MIELGGLLLEVDEGEEREMEIGAGSGNEDDRFGLDLEGLWANPQEELLDSEVLIAEGLEVRDGVEDPDSRPRPNRCSGLKAGPDRELDDEERGDERGDVKPLA